MKSRLIFFFKSYLFWVLFFVLQKPIFMIWQHSLLGDVRALDWLLVPLHGFVMDLSVASYVMAVIGLLLCISCWVRWKIIYRIIDVVNVLFLTVSIWVMLADNGCFPSWGYHINREIFTYLSYPQEALACAVWWVWLLAVVAFVVLLFVSRWVYVWWVKRETQQLEEEEDTAPLLRHRLLHTLGLLLLTGTLFLPIRGSVTTSTMNTGRAYFSENRMLNMAAVNPLFHLIESVCEDQFNYARYTYMSSDEAQLLTDSLYSRHLDVMVTDTLLTTQRPNIVLCIMESFSKNAMDAGAMPNLSKLAHEGVFFDHAFAASHRTDRGVMAVLSGFPGCATASLMMVPSKADRVPQVSQILREEGYQLKFYYGGDEDFTNMRSYLITGGFINRVCDHDFPLSDRMSKWGVPDHILLDYVADDILSRSVNAPTFDVVLTLSSHEPFEVPYDRFSHPYLNAIAYSDSCIGHFVDRLRQSDKWNNTLVVMVADHGYSYPDGIANYDTLQYKIPLLMCGGVIREPRVIHTCCQQVDWIPTVLHQMGLDARAFPFAKDVLDTRVMPFAYYNFVDGFALVNDSAVTIIDAEVDKVIKGTDEPAMVLPAHAVTQSVLEYISKL